MTLGTEVGLGPGDIVGWGPTPQKGGHRCPHFTVHVYFGQTAEWIKMLLGTEVGHGLGDPVLDGDPAPPRKGAQHPTFRPMYIVAKRSPISATAELF